MILLIFIISSSTVFAEPKVSDVSDNSTGKEVAAALEGLKLGNTEIHFNSNPEDHAGMPALPFLNEKIQLEGFVFDLWAGVRPFLFFPTIARRISASPNSSNFRYSSDISYPCNKS